MTGFEMFTGLPDETRMEMGGASYLGIGPKGDTGAAAGFGTPTATVDDNVGTPSVTVTATGADTSKVFSFAFHNLKGQQGQQGIQGIQGVPGRDGADGQDGQDGADGKSAYASAQDGGYTGTEAQFNSDLANVGEKIDEAPNDGQQYARKNKAWAVVTGGGGGGGTWGSITGDIEDQADLADALGSKADTDALTAYRTAAAQDVIDAGKLSTSGGTIRGDLTLSNGAKLTMNSGSTVFDEGGRLIFGENAGTMAVGVWDHILTLRGSGRPTFNNNDLAFLSDVTGKADKPTVKSTMDSVAAVNTIYNLGVQSAVPIVLPSNAPAMSQVQVIFYNGATAATLSITGTMLDCDYAPSANSRSEINALWDGTYWAVVTNEQALPEVVA